MVGAVRVLVLVGISVGSWSCSSDNTVRDDASMSNDAGTMEDAPDGADADADAATPPGTLVTVAAGGTVHSADGVLEIRVAPGALATDTYITITEVAAAAIPAEVAATLPVSKVYEAEPDGLTFGGDGAIVHYHLPTVPAGLITPGANGEPTRYSSVDAVARPTAGGTITLHQPSRTTYQADGSLDVSATLAHLSLQWMSYTTAEISGELAVDFRSEVQEVGDEWTATAFFNSDSTLTAVTHGPWAMGPHASARMRTGGTVPYAGRIEFALPPPQGGSFLPSVDYPLTPHPAWGCDSVGQDELEVSVELKEGYVISVRHSVQCVEASPPPATSIIATVETCTRFPGGDIDCAIAPPTTSCSVEIPAATAISNGIGQTTERTPIMTEDRADGPASLVATTDVNSCTATLSGTPLDYGISGIGAGGAYGADPEATWTVPGNAGFSQTVVTDFFANGPDSPLGNANGLATQIRVPVLTSYDVITTSLHVSQVGETEPSAVIRTTAVPNELEVEDEMYVAPIASPEIREYMDAYGLGLVHGEVCFGNTMTDTTLMSDGTPIIFMSANCFLFEDDDLIPPTDPCDTPELCDGMDNNCVGGIDEGCPSTFTIRSSAATTSPFFGSAPPGSTTATAACAPPGVVTGVHGREAGSIWQLGVYCGTMSMVENKTVTPYEYSFSVAAGTKQGLGGSSGGPAGTLFDLPCPSNMVVHRLLGMASAELGQLSIECVEWEMQEQPHNTWGIVRGATAVVGPGGAGTGASFDFTLPLHSSGIPQATTTIRGAYQPGTPITGVNFSGATGTLTLR